MIPRDDAVLNTLRSIEENPVTTILGPRQCGKTTLARFVAVRKGANSTTTFDLENPTHQARLSNPLFALGDLSGLIIGLLHSLLTLKTQEHLLGHPKVGASFEGFAIDQLLTLAPHKELFFWATHSGAEVDALLPHGGKWYGFEIKFTETPRITKSMRIAIQDCHLNRLYILYPGHDTFPLSERITALPIAQLHSLDLFKS